MNETQTRPTSSPIKDFKARHKISNDIFWLLVKKKRIKVTYFSDRTGRIIDSDEDEFLKSCRHSGE